VEGAAHPGRGQECSHLKRWAERSCMQQSMVRARKTRRREEERGRQEARDHTHFSFLGSLLLFFSFAFWSVYTSG